VQDKTAMPDKYSIGEEVKVQFNIKGSRWERDGRTNYITNLDAWRMESFKLASTNNNSSNYNDVPSAGVVDDLPF
jgi:hypothetical protein